MKEIQVIDTFDDTKDYGINIPPQSAKCLSVLKKGEQFITNDFVNEHLNEFTDKITMFRISLIPIDICNNRNITHYQH